MGDWAPVNAWWVYTTEDDLETCTDWQNDPSNGVSFVTNWWVGDFFADSPPPGPFGHFWFYGHNSEHIEDTRVHECATDYDTKSSKQKFNFIWTCYAPTAFFVAMPVWMVVGSLGKIL